MLESGFRVKDVNDLRLFRPVNDKVCFCLQHGGFMSDVF